MSFSVRSSKLRPLATPALLIRTVGFPMDERISLAAEAIAAVEVMSHLKKCTFDAVFGGVSLKFIEGGGDGVYRF
jgi:hypothetical protein